jgi:hypothetical protein
MANVSGQITEITDPGAKNMLAKWQYSAYARGVAFADRGHIFYAITSVADDQTLVYDVTSRQWHIRSSSEDGKLHAWDQSTVRACYGETWFATTDGNDVCRLNPDDIQDQRGRPITRYWQSAPITDGGQFIRLREVRIDVETGAWIGDQSAHALYLQAFLDGMTTGRVQRYLGAPGDRVRQISICAAGAGRDIVLRIGTSSRAPVILYSARVSLETSGRTA